MSKTPMNIIESLGSYKNQGEWAIMNQCVFNGCEDHLHISRMNGNYKCFICGEKGNFSDLLKYLSVVDIGAISFNKEIRIRPIRFPSQENIVKANTELLNNEEELYFLMDRKGITKKSVAKFNIGISGKHRFIVPTYYLDIPMTVIIFDYSEEEKKMIRMRASESTPFNINCIETGIKKLYIVEGHWDCITMIQLGIDYVVSTPSGAGCLKWISEYSWIFKCVEEVVLIYDNDQAGRIGASNAKALLKYEHKHLKRIENVVLPLNDINDCYMDGMDMRWVKNI